MRCVCLRPTDLRGDSQDHDFFLRIGNTFGNQFDHVFDRYLPRKTQLEKCLIPCMIPIANVEFVALSDVSIDEEHAR